MILTMTQADEEMAALFRQAWEVTAGYPCLWPNSKAAGIDKEKIWAHWSVTYTGGRQLSFGPVGRRKFEKTGSVVIVVFTPYGKGQSNARGIAEIALGAYEGKRTPGGVVFRDVRIDTEGQGQTETGSTGWWATAVVAPFNYETLR